MGIENLRKLILAKAPNCYKKLTLGKLKNEIICIDTSQWLYAFNDGLKNASYYREDVNGDSTSHLYSIISRTGAMFKACIKPIYVFDPVSRNKDAVVNKRIYETTIELLKLLGVPYIICDREAEAICAYLTKKNIAYGVVSNDFDSFTFGATRVISSNFLSLKKSLPSFIYESEKLLKDLNFTQSQFIDFSILLGCDYCPSVKGISKGTAWKYIQDYGCLEQILKVHYDPLFSTTVNLQEVRDKFVVDNINIKIPELEWGRYDEEGLYNFLLGKISTEESAIIYTINKYKESLRTREMKTTKNIVKRKLA